MNEKKRTVQFLTIIPYNWKIHRPYFNLSFFKIQFQILSTRFNLSSSKNAYISHLSNFSIQKRNSYNGKNYLAKPGIRIDSVNSRNETSFQQKLRVNRSRERRKKGRKKKKKKKKDEQALERNGRNQNSVCTPQQLSGSHCVHLGTFRSKKGTLFA